jgi:hypothetical protein
MNINIDNFYPPIYSIPPPSQPSPTGEGVVPEERNPFPPGGNKKGGKNHTGLIIMNIQKELYSSTQSFSKVRKDINVYFRSLRPLRLPAGRQVIPLRPLQLMDFDFLNVPWGLVPHLWVGWI